jgi:hypothetical protein
MCYGLMRVQMYHLLASALGGGAVVRPSASKAQPRQQPRGLTYIGFTATPSPKVGCGVQLCA